MVVTLCTVNEAVRKAGVRANSTIVVSSAAVENWINQAEGLINSQTRTDWVTLYSGLSDSYKFILNDGAASQAAMDIINYDMSGYSSRIEAETMLDVLRDRVTRVLKTLEDMKVREKIGG